jgi:hypothetical protein
MCRGDFVAPKNVEPVFQNGFRRLCAIATIPVFCSNPVAKFRTVVRPCSVQLNRTDKGPVLQADCEDSSAPFVKTGLMRGDPGFSDTILVWMRDQQRPLINFPIAGERLHLWCIGQCERPQNQSLSLNRFLYHHPLTLGEACGIACLEISPLVRIGFWPQFYFREEERTLH